MSNASRLIACVQQVPHEAQATKPGPGDDRKERSLSADRVSHEAHGGERPGAPHKRHMQARVMRAPCP